MQKSFYTIENYLVINGLIVHCIKTEHGGLRICWMLDYAPARTQKSKISTSGLPLITKIILSIVLYGLALELS